MRTNIIKKTGLLLPLAITIIACNSNELSDGYSIWNDTNISENVGFNVDITQDWYEDNASSKMKAAACQPKYISMKSTNGLTAYLEETTINGINTVTPSESQKTEAKSERTRGLPITDTDNLNNFGSFCYKSNGSPYYNNVACGKDGVLTEKWVWPRNESLVFYAIHPYDNDNSKYTAASSSTGLKYRFSVNEDVSQQKDLMYASTGSVAYNNSYTAPLHFRHALTAVRFAVGSNLSYGGKITKITLNNVYTTGTYTLPKSSTNDDVEGTWSELGSRKSITLSNINISTDENPNTIIVGGDRTPTYTFLMIPQDLTGIVAEITLNIGGTEEVLTANLSGGSGSQWLEGTTRTYKLSNSSTSNWQYVLQAASPAAMAYNATESGAYSITSYRQHSNGSSKQAIGWTVKEYEYSYDGTNWINSGTTKPEWLEELTLESGTGGTAAQTGKAIIDAQSYIKDYLAERNNSLKEATPRYDYDLSLHDWQGNETLRNTANCYIISAPGQYKLPLVYGKAIKDGEDNPASYPSTYNYTNYKGTKIEAPWLSSNSADGIATSASLILSDISEDIIKNPQVNGDFLSFEVPANEIKEGNAIIAVKDANGEIMWSWHLWFVPENALGIATFNAYSDPTIQGGVLSEALGWKYSTYLSTTYSKPRLIRVTVQQSEGIDTSTGLPKTATFTITQNNFSNRQGNCARYEWGRKDVLWLTDIVVGAFSDQSGSVDYATAIRNPTVRYTKSGSVPTWFTKFQWNSGFSNIWSSRSVYDPCPVGFYVPARSGVFTSDTFKNSNPEKIQNGTYCSITGLNGVELFVRGESYWVSGSTGSYDSYIVNIGEFRHGQNHQSSVTPILPMAEE